MHDALVICHADDYKRIEGAIAGFFASRKQALVERELLNFIAAKLMTTGAAVDISYAGFYESLTIDNMINTEADTYNSAIITKGTMQTAWTNALNDADLMEAWNSHPRKEYLDRVCNALPLEVGFSLEEASKRSSWPTAGNERAVLRIHDDRLTIGVVVICKLPDDEDDEDTVLEDDPPPPVRVKAVWKVKGESFSVDLEGIFGLPPVNDDKTALSQATGELFASLLKAFKNVDQADPRPFEEGCQITSCAIQHAKNTHGIRHLIRGLVLTVDANVLTIDKITSSFRSAFPDGRLDGHPGEPIAELEVLIEGLANPTKPGVEEEGGNRGGGG